jgi:signal transduction histidine kinase
MNTLRARFLTAQLMVIVLMMVLFLVAAAIITPRIHGRLIDDGNPPPPRDAPALNDALRAEMRYRSALWRAMLISGGVASVVAVLVSVTLARVIVAPLQHVTRASRRVASGDYSPIALPDATTVEIRELATQFNHMATALRDAEQRRAALIGDVAHELRTPLASIEGYAEGLIDGVVVPGEKSFTIIRDESQRLRRIVDDLQALSRAEAGTLTLYREVQDMHDIAQRAVALLNVPLAEKNIQLHLQAPHTKLLVDCDGDRMVQVVLNLLTNAIRALQPGGTIWVSLGRDDGMVWCRVRDDGIGIAAEHLARVFERFYRVDPSRARTTGGSGVGLTIAKAIVEAHGGRLNAASDGVGRGATFEVYLPQHVTA